MPIRRLRAQLRRFSPCAVFLGAGASVESGGRTGRSVAFAILNEIYGRRQESELEEQFWNENKRPVTFENVLYHLSHDSIERKRLISGFFQSMEPSPGYINLALMLRLGYFSNIVLTTNFDDMLARAIGSCPIGQVRTTCRSISYETLRFPLQCLKDEIVIVKLHGDISGSSASRLKITPQETAYLSPACEKLVKSILKRNGLVVIGYSAGDIGVTTALFNYHSSEFPLYWVAPSSADFQDLNIQALLKRSQSEQNVIEATFDAFMYDLCRPALIAIERKQYEKDLEAAWSSLEEIRNFGEDRLSRLTAARADIERLCQSVDLDEAKALLEFISYEHDHSGELYRLEIGMQLMEGVVSIYPQWLDEETILFFDYVYIREVLHSLISGSQSFSDPSVSLDGLIELARSRYKEVAVRSLTLRSRMAVLLSELLKESAMVTRDLVKHRALYKEARSLTETVIGSMSSRGDRESRLLLGLAFRHGAVTYELEGDDADGYLLRRQHYEKWRAYSRSAVEVLAGIGESRERGFALLNEADSLSRLSDMEDNASRKAEFLHAAKAALTESSKQFRLVDDIRGLGWLYIHVCGVTKRRLQISNSAMERRELLSELESSANRAVAMIKRGGDQLARGLALKVLGSSLLVVGVEHQHNSLIRLRRSAAALQEAIDIIAKTGYYRGRAETFLVLGQCYQEIWKQTNSEKDFVLAFRMVTEGVLLLAEDLGFLDRLRSHYEKLYTELITML